MRQWAVTAFAPANHVNVTHLGVVSGAEKLSAIAASRLLVHPSPYESLSMALLEAWKMERPAVVNGRCTVLRGQVQRANGGLYYASYEEFAVGQQGKGFYEEVDTLVWNESGSSEVEIARPIAH